VERTADNAESATACRFGRFILDRSQRRLLCDGAPVELEERVFDLILLLLDNRARALDRREVIDALWGKRPVSDATLRQLLYKARRVLDDDGTHQTVIRTLHGRSLQWVAPVAPLVDRRMQPMPTTAPWLTQPTSRPEDAELARDRPGTPTGSGTIAGGGSVADTGHVAEATRRDGAASPPAARYSPAPRSSPRRRSVRGALILLLALVLIGVSGALWMRQTAGPLSSASAQSRLLTTSDVPTRPVTLAVLPFLNMGPDPHVSYLSDGLTEELIDRLGRFPGLRVAARTSTFVFRDKPVDVREAGRALGVTNILEGSVQRTSDHWRVRVALISASDGYVLWTAEYNPPVTEMIDTEDTISHKVVEQLQPRLDLRVLAAAHARAPANPAARDFYLIGLEYLNRRTAVDNAQAIAYFRRSIQADPGYAPAWSGVAAAYAILRDYNDRVPPDTHYTDALSAANKAIALDPTLSRPHAVLGELYDEHWQWAQAAREFKLALQLDPSNATANQWYGLHLWYTGDNAGALAQMRKARDLDPLSSIINTNLGRALRFNGDTPAAIAQYQATIAMSPGFALAHLLLAQAEIDAGKYPLALAETRAAIALTPAPHPSSYLAVLGVAQSLAGDRSGAREQLATLETRSRQQYVSGVSLALLYWQFGKKDQAMANLTRAVASYDSLMRPAVADRTAGWRSDPRFGQLLAKMGLPR
jgi:TolB-like protein/DNA-binding winged helix-turn-helix (wHTH) protein/Tfp pilus assembly protein PilF